MFMHIYFVCLQYVMNVPALCVFYIICYGHILRKCDYSVLTFVLLIPVQHFSNKLPVNNDKHSLQ